MTASARSPSMSGRYAAVAGLRVNRLISLAWSIKQRGQTTRVPQRGRKDRQPHDPVETRVTRSAWPVRVDPQPSGRHTLPPERPADGSRHPPATSRRRPMPEHREAAKDLPEYIGRDHHRAHRSVIWRPRLRLPWIGAGCVAMVDDAPERSGGHAAPPAPHAARWLGQPPLIVTERHCHLVMAGAGRQPMTLPKTQGQRPTWHRQSWAAEPGTTITVVGRRGQDQQRLLLAALRRRDQRF